MMIQQMLGRVTERRVERGRAINNQRRRCRRCSSVLDICILIDGEVIKPRVWSRAEIWGPRYGEGEE